MTSLRIAAGVLMAVTAGIRADDEERIGELEDALRAIAEEVADLRLQGVETAAEPEETGLGPAASKVYGRDRGVSLGGYGEVVYTRFDDEMENGEPSGAKDEIDMLRTVVYVGYKFSDDILLNTELEWEHGGSEISTEFAYLEFRLAEEVGLRGGMLLVPLGYINELHEPPTFYGAERPEVERFLIPTTWRANGIGGFYRKTPANVRVYLVEGLRAAGFSASGGLRGGRQKGQRAVAESWGLVARVDVTPLAGVVLGSGLYYGNSGQDEVPAVEAGGGGGDYAEVRTVIWEGHGQFQARGLHLRGMVTLVTLDDVDALNDALDLEGTDSVGERMVGGYMEAAYDVMPLIAPQARNLSLSPFVRYQVFNTQDEVPEGFGADPGNKRTTVTAGFHFKPHPLIAAKADVQIQRTDGNTGIDRFHLGLGYLF